MPRLRPGATLREQQRWIAARHPNTTFELAGGAPTVMGPTLEQYDRLANEYPEVAARIRLVRVAQLPTARRLGEPTEWARATADDGEPPYVLTLNRSMYGRPGRMARENRRLVDGGWHPDGTVQVEATLTHEFGHLVMFWLQDLGYSPVEFVRQIEGVGELSNYAKMRVEEAWSEAFRTHHHGDASLKNHPATRTVMEYVAQTSREIRARKRSQP